MDQPNAIVCLVGENPLPVYLGARQFANEQCSIVLVHSKETKPQADRIAKQLVADGKKNTTSVELAEPYAARRVTELLRAEHLKYPDAWLNYTGGTKVMSAFAVKQWQDDDKAFYLDEGTGVFRFANGCEKELARDIADTETVGKLHGITVKHRSNHEFEAQIDLEVLKNFYRQWPKPKNQSAEERAPFMPDSWGDFGDTDENRKADADVRWQNFQQMSGLFREIPAPQSADALDDGKYKHQYKFAATAWQELLILRLIEVCGFEGFIKGTYFRIDGQDFETDVLGVLNNRLYFLSCTTATKQNWIKAKAFEAVYRARQLGGGMARVAVVSFADPTTVSKVCQSLSGVPRIKVFGTTDVENWIAGEMDSLRDFLES